MPEETQTATNTQGNSAPAQQTQNQAAQTDASQPKQESPKQTETSSKVDDIVARVSKLKESIDPSVDPNEPTGFNSKDLENIQDPQARQFAENAYKELNRGFQKKFQELAELRKELEGQKGSGNLRSKQFSLDDIQEVLQNPSFVQAAQIAAGQQGGYNQSNGALSDEEWGALSPQERARFTQMEQSQQLLQKEISSMRTQQEDARLQDKYANYDGSKISQLQQDLISGKMQATREHLWKVLDYESAVQRAYKLGLEDRQSGMQEKANAISSNSSVNVTPNSEVPSKNPNESNTDYFRRLALRRLEEQKHSQGR